MKTYPLYVGLALLATPAFAAPPESAKTNRLGDILNLHFEDLHCLEYEDHNAQFSQAYMSRLGTEGNSITSDRIGYTASFRIAIESLHHEYDWNESLAHQGGRAVMHTLGDTLRDSFVERMPLDAWEDTLESKAHAWLHNFVVGSVANTSEERRGVSIYSSEESVILGQSWHYEHGWIPQMGYRVGTKPYVYTESYFGRQPGGLPLAYLNLRCYSDLESLDHFGEMKVEAHAIIPIDHLFQVGIGFAGYPLESNSHDQHWSEVIRFDRSIGPGIASVGFHFRDNEQKVVGQFTVHF